MDILEINNYLKQGKTVKEIRDILGYSEKSYQRKIKEILIHKGFLFDFSLITIIIFSTGNAPVKKGACINEYTRF